jgi:DnaJ-class molecular chaperone
MKIEICSGCYGFGSKKIDIGTHESDILVVECETCNGTGKICINTYNYMVSYKTDIDLINEYDAKIIELIRELEMKAKLQNKDKLS